jgi:membrane protein DedA with SNARE-associated domain
MKEFMISMIQHYGYAAVLVSMMLGVIGLPLPVEFLLFFAGSIVAAAKLHFVWLILFAWLGATLGMAVNYWLGKTIGIERISKITQWVHLTEDRLHAWAKRFQTRGPFLIVFGFFVTGLRHASPFIAGASNMPFKRFMFYTLGGGLFWILSFSCLGQKFGRHWHSIAKLTHHPLLLAAGILVAVGALAFKKRYFSFISHLRGVK